MFKHGSSFRTRLAVAFVATALFVVPAVAQEVTIEINACWLSCHQQGQNTYNEMMALGWVTEGDAIRAANIAFVGCMEANCGGM